MTISEKFWTFSILQLWNRFSGKRKLFKKTGVLKALRLKTHHFHTKLPYQKPMLRQIEWWLQNGPITKNGVLPVTTSFFKKLCFSLRTSYKELIWCTNDPVPIFILFVSTGVLFDGAFSLWVSLKKVNDTSKITNNNIVTKTRNQK